MKILLGTTGLTQDTRHLSIMTPPPAGEAQDDGSRKCTEAALRAWWKAGSRAGGPPAKTYMWSLGEEWSKIRCCVVLLATERLVLKEDGKCTLTSAQKTPGQDDSSASHYAGRWGINEVGLLECWFFKFGGHGHLGRLGDDDPAPPHGPEVEHAMWPKWYKVLGNDLVEMKKGDSVDAEHESEYRAPEAEPVRVVLTACS